MRKGFTLLELMIVIIIVGVLATLGIMQYQAAIERSRGAEAKAVFSGLRSQCASFYLQLNHTGMCTDANLSISDQANIQAGRIPGSDCWTTNFFRYASVNDGATNVTFTATRCQDAGKEPNLPGEDRFINLTVDYLNGVDFWESNGGY